MDPHFLNGSQDGSVRGRGGPLGRGRGGPPGAGGPRFEHLLVSELVTQFDTLFFLKSRSFSDNSKFHLCWKGVGECRVEALAERCVVEPHGEQWDEAMLHEADHLVEVDLLHLLLTEEVLPTAPDPLQQELQGCCQLQHCHTNRSLQHHSPKLKPTRTMYVWIKVLPLQVWIFLDGNRIPWVLMNFLIVILGCLWRAICRTFIWGIWKLLQSASGTCVSRFILLVLLNKAKIPLLFILFCFLPTERLNIMTTDMERPKKRHMKLTVIFLNSSPFLYIRHCLEEGWSGLMSACFHIVHGLSSSHLSA